VTLVSTVDHLIQNVLAAAGDNDAAEQALSQAYSADQTPAAWETAARLAKRRAAEAAIAIDGLTDRAAAELGRSKTNLRTDIAALCFWPGSTILRAGAHDRVRGVSNAYKHQDLCDPTLPITSDADILVVGLGYGLDGYGVGKFGGVEVLVHETGGDRYKFLGDVPTAVAAWFRYLAQNGAVLPPGPLRCCDIDVHRERVP
jgi:hypothetical protein